MVNVVSTFSGCGGSCLGYTRAGFKVLLASDFDAKAVKTYQMNFPKTKIIKGNIREINGQSILKMINLKKGELDIFDGSPPCTPFSMAGKREQGWNKAYVHASESTAQRSDDLFYEYIRLIKELNPKIFIGENVRGLIGGKAKGYFNNILKNMKKLGYTIRVLDIDAQNFEVPQQRRRIIFVGIRKDQFKEWKPLITMPRITVRQAISDLKHTKEEIKETLPTSEDNMTAKIMNVVKPGERASKYHPKGHYFGHARLAWDQPCPTILCHSSMLTHPKENRYLTLSEAKRLASFPDNFKFLTRNDGFIRIGNSVPPNLMKNVSKWAVSCSKISS